MSKAFKIKFVDFWPGFNTTENYFTEQIEKHIDFQISDHPEFLFYSNFGKEHKNYYNCIRIYFTGENRRPNYSECDYSISFDYNEDERNLRWPLYNLYPDIEKLTVGEKKFCSILVSNASNNLRIKFFKDLLKYKKVDSGGRIENNIGYQVESKMDFISKYKFNLAFENSSFPGYTTEKLYEAKLAGCIPIYWGNPRINEDFNSECFINLNKFDSIDECIEFIRYVDMNDSVFEKIRKQPLFTNDQLIHKKESSKLQKFLKNIMLNPISSKRNRLMAKLSSIYDIYHTKQYNKRQEKKYLI